MSRIKNFRQTRLHVESLEDRSMLSASAPSVSLGPLAQDSQTVSPQVTESAQVKLTYMQASAGVFQYTVFLQDTGATPIGTLWYGWVPGENFMPVSPTNIVDPAGWSHQITGGGGSDGFAIQWVATSPITPGTQLTGFKFDSTATPSQLQGLSTFHPSMPVGTSFVYQAGPETDAGDEFVASPVSDPWQNPFNALDVAGDGNPIVPQDALDVIDYLNLHASGPLPTIPPAGSLFVDVEGTGTVIPHDALDIIDFLNTHPVASPAVTGAGMDEENAVALQVSGVPSTNVNSPSSASPEIAVTPSVQSSDSAISPAVVAAGMATGRIDGAVLPNPAPTSSASASSSQTSWVNSAGTTGGNSELDAAAVDAALFSVSEDWISNLDSNQGNLHGHHLATSDVVLHATA